MRLKPLAFAFVLALPAIANANPFSLYAGNNVSLGHHGNVSGNVGAGNNVQMDGYTNVAGSIKAGNNVSLNQHLAVAGNVLAGQQVAMDGYAVVSGNVDAGKTNGVAVNMGQHSAITGTAKHYATGTIKSSNGSSVGVNASGTPDAFSAFELPGATSFTSGDDDIQTNGNITTVLTAGSYGKLDLGHHNTLKLGAGNYYFESLKADGYNNFIFDLTGGAIKLFFAGNVSIGSNLDVQTIGGTGVYAETKGNWKQDGYGEWFGTIYASANGGDLSFGHHSNLIGSYYAKQNITIDGYSGITYAALPEAAETVPEAAEDVPEPGTLMLLGAGLLGLAINRRRAGKSQA